MKTKIIISAGAAVALLYAAVASADTSKSYLCHATSSVTNPTVLISVSDNAVPAQLAEGSTFAVQLSDGSYTCEAPTPTPTPTPAPTPAPI